MAVRYGKVYAWYELEGFEYSSVIGGTYVSPTSILKLCEQARAVGSKILYDLYGGQNMKPPMLFLGWQQVEVTAHFKKMLSTFQAIQSRDDTFRSMLHFLRMKLYVHHIFDPVGNSSQGFQTVISEQKTNQPLIYCVGKMVAVDPQTRRPKPHPEFFKHHFSSDRDDHFIKIERTIPNKCTNLVNTPTGAKVYERPHHVSSHEVDRNSHTNQSVYGKMCFNCLAEAVSEKFCGRIKGSIWAYPLRSMSVRYMKESGMGDHLNIVMWQDAWKKLVFHFNVMKASDVICQAEFELFEPERKLTPKL